MKCPACGSMETKVIDSRVIEKWKWIKRRRSCEYCEHRFTTIEKIIVTDLIVIKRDHTKELYDRDKIKKSLTIAYWKKNFSMETIDDLTAQLEAKWSGSGKEITSKKIGEDILELLKKTDEIAYVRFASVFMEFDWIDDFAKFVKEPHK